MKNDIGQTIGLIRGGVFANEVSTELAALLERIQASGKKGTLTIALTITPKGAGNRMVEITPKLSVKKPAAPETEEPATFFVQRGALLRDDPEQRKLPFVRDASKNADDEASQQPGQATGTGNGSAFI